MEPKIKPGDVVEDTLTGFVGTVTARTEWIGGLVRVEVQGRSIHEGVPTNAQWFDVSRVEVVS